MANCRYCPDNLWSIGRRFLGRELAAFLTCVLIAGCSHSLSVVRPSTEIGDTDALARYTACSDFYAALNESTRRTGVGDAQSVPVGGFAYLRTNRFLASFANEQLDREAFEGWVDKMNEAALSAWAVELANLPEKERGDLLERTPDWLPAGATLLESSKTCGHLQRRLDLSRPSNREALRVNAAEVPPQYRTWQRVAGLYYLTLWPVRQGIKRWQAETRSVFRKPLRDLPVTGELITFAPPAEHEALDRSDVAAIIARSPRGRLGIPDPRGKDRERLFAAFAPRWQIDVLGDADRIGQIRWRAGEGAADVQTTQPTVYRYVSHTRLGGDVLLQLNYIVWFPARRQTSAFDLLAGHLDGITWRVTIAANGAPLLYDTIHNCGCYHLFLPSEAVETIAESKALQEDAFVVQQAPSTAALTLRIAHTSHYLQRVYPAIAGSGPTETYHWADYEELRSLPLADGSRRSLFRPDGIVEGTDRGERWVLWPMGVPHPGAMRQWGHHATAFVGRRHFDDPFLYHGIFAIRRQAITHR